MKQEAREFVMRVIPPTETHFPIFQTTNFLLLADGSFLLLSDGISRLVLQSTV